MDEKYQKLTDFGKKLLDYKSLDKALPYISENASNFLSADRCSIFIHDVNANELWTTLADKSQRIILPFDMGIVGETIKIQKPILENNPYDNQNFFHDIDLETGYYTQNILTSPIFDSQRGIIGVIELLNKEGGFKKEDIKILSFFAHYVSGYIELTDLIKESNGTY